ncbi:MAG TPA: hypothetical protein VFF28_01995 [Candidatus Nanoarchaeia archaeon]|nr:hypothetical protein [Candidatus Nanoarchaeia archaeon]
MKVTCEDGFAIQIKNEKEIIEHTQTHMKNFHNKDMSADDIRGIMKAA